MKAPFTHKVTLPGGAAAGMWRPRLPWDRSLEGPGGCAHVRANETGGQGRAEGWDGRDTGLSQCPP